MPTINQILAFYVVSMIGMYFLLPELRKWRDSAKYGRLINEIDQLRGQNEYLQFMLDNSLNGKIKRNGRAGQLSFDLGVKQNDPTLIEVSINGATAYFKRSDLSLWNNGYIPVDRPVYDRSGRKIKVESLWIAESDLQKNDRPIPFVDLAVNRKN